MVSKQAVIITVIAIVTLIIGAGIGYGAAGTKTTTVTSPTTLTFYTPLITTTTATVRETVSIYTFSTVTRAVTATATLLQPITMTITVKPTPTQKVVEAVIRQVVQVGPWKLAVLDVKEVTYIKTLSFGTWNYYQAPEGMKIVIAKLRIENTANEAKASFGPAELSIPILVTDVNKSYDKAYRYQLKSILRVTSDIEEKAVEYNELDVFIKLAPESYIEGDIMYLIPQTEKPAKLVIEYWPSPFEPKTVIVIKLS